MEENQNDDEPKFEFKKFIPKNKKAWAQFIQRVLNDEVTLNLYHKTRTATFTCHSFKKHPTPRPYDQWLTGGIQLFQLYEWYEKEGQFPTFVGIMRTLFPQCPLLKGLQSMPLPNWEGKILMACVKGFAEGSMPTFTSDFPLLPSEWISFLTSYPNRTLKLMEYGLLEFHSDGDGIPSMFNITAAFHALVLEGKVNPHALPQHLPQKGQFALMDPLQEAAHHVWDSSIQRTFDWTKALCQKKKHRETSISYLIYGPPGTGKTAYAHSLAHGIKGKIMQVNYAELHSKWVGETEKNIEQLFRRYAEISSREDQPIILLLNEADGLFAPRVQVMHSNDIHANNIQIQLLEWLEKFKGILIATTNKQDHLDEAFMRRFLFKLKMNGITAAQRKKIIQQSPIQKWITPTLRAALCEQDWNPGQWSNAEKKILALSDCITIGEEWMEEILREEGMLTPVKKLGFAAYRPTPPTFGLAAEG